MVERAEDRVRRIAVILGPGGGSRYLLDRLKPLLAVDRDLELQGVFFEEAGVKHAAELPFVKELCRVTFAVREFDRKRFENALALRIRSARQALGVLAEHAGVPLTFRNARGSAVALLQETLAEADYVVFEPARPPMAPVMSNTVGTQRRQRIAAVITETGSANAVLETALKFSGSDSSLLNVLLFPHGDEDAASLRALYREILPGEPGHVRLLSTGDFRDLAVTNRQLLSSMLVASADGSMVQDQSLRFLLAQVRCPVCLVSYNAVLTRA